MKKYLCYYNVKGERVDEIDLGKVRREIIYLYVYSIN